MEKIEQSKVLNKEISLNKVEKRLFYAKIATYAGPPPPYDSEETTSEGFKEMTSINIMNNYDSGL